MKKTILTRSALFILLTIQFSMSKAQTLTGGIDYLNSGITYISNGQQSLKNDLSSKQGFRIGVNFNYMFSDNFGISTGLNYAQKGFNLNTTDNSQPGYSLTYNESISMNYIDLPILFKTQIETGEVKPFLDLGLNLGIGLNGTQVVKMSETYMGSTSTNSENREVTFGYGGEMFKRFDVGLVAQGGIELEKFVFTLGYNYGITNHASSPETVFQHSFRIGAAYKIISND